MRIRCVMMTHYHSVADGEAQPGHHQVQRDGVEANGDDHVAVPPRRLHVLLVHRPHGGQVLLDDALHGAPALHCVALHAPDEPYICVCVDKDLDVNLVPETLVAEEQHTCAPEGHSEADDQTGTP
eukprot:TRINITY_DN6437_c0_g1_i2.p2 TRINITY_DN6437_c0_g1~~TRINITY_DN6437_c0_g1_i2.p2  ORF type:complete len:125 (+),score=12.35 TRINITY_DN6437_c0_g1_i2:425-799(+)